MARISFCVGGPPLERDPDGGTGDTGYQGRPKVVADLEAQGLDVLYDDRPKVSPGVKFKDAELIGVPTIVVLGRGLADGVVEVKDRRSGDKRDVPLAELTQAVVTDVRG